MEILSLPDPVEISVSPTTSQDTTQDGVCVEPSVAAVATTPPPPPLSEKHTKHTTTTGIPNLPATYVALYPYKPQKFDELELKKGCKFIYLFY